MRMRSSLSVVAALVAATLVGPPTPASAATTLTWTGAASTSWTDPGNWSPAKVPVAGDSVVVDGAGALQPVDRQRAVALAAEPDRDDRHRHQRDPRRRRAVDGHRRFGWTGGTSTCRWWSPALGTIATNPANPAKFGGSLRTLTVSGELDLLGPGATAANSSPSVELMFDSNLVVTPPAARPRPRRASWRTGAAASRPRRSPTRVPCACMGQRQADQPRPRPVRVDRGTARGHARGDGRADAGLRGLDDGGGRVQVVSTSGDSFAPLEPTAPDTTLKLLGDLTLGGGLSLQLDTNAIMSGVGRLIGAGELVLAGGRVRGAVDLGVPVRTVAGTTSRIAIWATRSPGSMATCASARAGPSRRARAWR